ncbi:IS3 family transposase [Leucobacter manosquensis]|uniref:Integrase catalytic domain-containing protein n=1 Tax=Leucobacter manosquensis TaxID=2810611 RepID=A0ABS5M402_9MICO|nr:IS3 family transposase [Leucobacter manosquensis]MBS3181930.1 hypothetical protein [Leucobacter manosquensis]
MGTLLVVCCTQIVDRNFEAGNFAALLISTPWSGRWAESVLRGDNAAMESFFSLLQKNVLNRRTWATCDELRIAIMTWIERTYHRRRRQARLGRWAPIEYEAIMNEQVALAA